jgi:nucleoside-diphosphate-sugar epimerase
MDDPQATSPFTPPFDMASCQEPVLVTGASGFIGSKVVETLLKYGFGSVRCLVRPSSRLSKLNEILRRFPAGENVELVKGDLLSRDDCATAVEGIRIIYHLAAGIEKSFAGAFMNSVVTTRNLLDAFLSYAKPKRFVNVSSFAVYSNFNLARGALLDETCPLEDAPQARFDAYGYAKLKQDKLVEEYGRRHRLDYVIIRPGAVFGPGKAAITGRVGIDTFGFFMHLGGKNVLPLTYLDNCAEAIVMAGVKPGIEGEVFNVVDDDLPTSRHFLRTYASRVPRFASLRLPYPVAYLGCTMWEKYAHWSNYQLPPAFNRRRCASEWKGNRYSNRKLKERVGWIPRVNMREAMDSFLGQF